MKTMEKKHHTVGTVPKFIRKIVERSKIYTPNTQILDKLNFLEKRHQTLNIVKTLLLEKRFPLIMSVSKKMICGRPGNGK
jgi:hypothetical protein